MSITTKLYGLLCYLFALGMLVAFMLFANNDMGLLGWPALLSLNIDQVKGEPAAMPLLVNLALLLLFGLQHSVMARPAFKRLIAGVVPVTCERSTYLLATGLVLLAIVLYWQPMDGNVWTIDHPVARNAIVFCYYAGWSITVLATFMLNHFHLFGLQQSFGSGDPDAGTKVFRTPLLYRLVRHPIQTGVVIAMVASPDMTQGRAMLATGMLAYVAIGLFFEEKDLINEFGQKYVDYRRRVPAVLPLIRRR